LATLKKAGGLEDGVQVIEVGSNLFQFKFRLEFELNRVFTGGPWSFDNQKLLLTRWKAGMTVMNVKFDSVALWVQIWGAPFDMRTPRVAEEVGNLLGRVLEVKKRRNNDSQNFFMRVKMAIPIEKEICRGAFLAGSDGRKYWVDLKYERLPVFCHYCGLFGHDLRYCAQYFSKTKNGVDVECGYGDWPKATGGRARLPQKRGFGKEGRHDGDKGATEGHSASQGTMVMEESCGGEDRNPNKTVIEVVGDEIRIVGEDLACSGNRVKNHGIGGAGWIRKAENHAS